MDLNALDLQELKQLRKDVEKAIVGFEARKKKEALVVLEKQAAEFGFSLADLTGAMGKSTSAPKYANPDDSSQTWTGRGRQPQWFKDAIAAGKSEQDLLIKI